MVVTLKVTDTEILKKWSKEELQEQFEKFLILKLKKKRKPVELVELEEHEVDFLPESAKKALKNIDKLNFVEY